MLIFIFIVISITDTVIIIIASITALVVYRSCYSHCAGLTKISEGVCAGLIVSERKAS